MITIRPAGFGRAAAEALRDELRAAKADDPLAPATVLVPTNYVGVAVRRRLAMGELGSITTAGQGIAGVDLLTVYRLAELLGATALAAEGRRPVSNPLVAAAIRTVLGANPGIFAPVADHPATERSLVRVHRELRDLRPAQLDVLAGASARAAEVVRVHREVATFLAPEWYDEFDLLAAATAAIERNPADITRLGRTVLYLPQDLSQGAGQFLATVAGVVDLTCVVGVTGVRRADEGMRRAVRRLGVELELDQAAPSGPAVADHIESVSDADEEVRAVLRRVLDDLRSGVPLERIAVLYGASEPYARLLDEQLEAAGIARNGDTVRSLDESMVGRTVLGLLAWPDQGFRRDEFFELLSSAPVRLSADQPGQVPVAGWERIARAAGVIGGLEQWRQRLHSYCADRLHDIDRLERTEPDHPRIATMGRDIELANQLLGFVEDLGAALDPADRPATWSELAAWAAGLAARYLGPPDEQLWPAVEVAAAEQIDRAIHRLAGLDDIEPHTTATVFRRTLELEFDSGLGRVGAAGEGVFVGRIAQALGFDLDRLYILGMAEGTYPARRRDDSLLPDHERSLLGDALTLRSADIDEQHRFLLAALASTAGRRTMLFPRGDLRRSSERVPSRWLLDTASSLGDQPLDGEQFAARCRAGADDWLTEVPSFVAGVRRSSFPPTSQEFDLASLLAAADRGEAPERHHLHTDSSAFSRGLELTRARISHHFTRFDGDLRAVATAEGTRADVLAPTRLETWAGCPHAYFMGSVLGVGELDAPDTLLRIDALERGNLMHEALEQFFSDLLDDGSVPSPGQPFSDAHHTMLAQIGRQLAANLEGRGLVGKAIFWERDQRDILGDLDELLRRELTRERRGHLLGAEVGFGVIGAARGPVNHQLPSGKVVRFRGSIDRLEQTPGGGLIVIDYKTGRDTRYRGLGQENPDLSGTKLQLPVYALAARELTQQPDAAVHAAYWFVTGDRGQWRWIGLDVDEAVMGRFDEVLTTIVDGIEGGVFPPRPPESDNPAFVECAYCDPDGLGTSEVRSQWLRKRHDPALAHYVALAEPEAILDV